jgi:hypothetical protein
VHERYAVYLCSPSLSALLRSHDPSGVQLSTAKSPTDVWLPLPRASGVHLTTMAAPHPFVVPAISRTLTLLDEKAREAIAAYSVELQNLSASAAWVMNYALTVAGRTYRIYLPAQAAHPRRRSSHSPGPSSASST